MEGQATRVLSYIKEHGSITQLEAIRELSVMRLASRISDLKRSGYPIKSRTVKVINKFDEPCRISQYYLEEI